MTLVDMTGKQFGRLTVIRRDGCATGTKDLAAWFCQCACGKTTTVAGPSLRRGLTTSCGCLWREWLHSPRSHGHARVGKCSPEYRTWAAMIRRCEHPSGSERRIYGHVSVCDRWRNNFEAFLSDMGNKPSQKHSLDRMDNSRGYEPGNCRWATPGEQVANRSITLKDGGLTISELANRHGLKYQTVRDRYARGDRGDRLVRPPQPSRWNNNGRIVPRFSPEEQND